MLFKKVYVYSLQIKTGPLNSSMLYPTMHVSRSSSLSASSISADARLGIFSSGTSKSTDSCCTRGRPRRTRWSACDREWEEDSDGWEEQGSGKYV